MAESAPMPMCPMAKTCKGMMDNSLSRFTLIIPGVVLIILGVTVLVEPRILAWLAAIVLIAIGIAMLVLTRFMRRIGERSQRMPG